MWVKLNNRLLNLERATDIGIREKSVTVYFGNSEFWSTAFDSRKEAYNAFDLLSEFLDTKNIVELAKAKTHLEIY